MKKIKTFIERSNDGSYSAYIENNTLNYGIHGTGKTAKEAVDDFMSAYEAMKEFYNMEGIDFEEVDFEFQYDMSSFLQYYSKTLSLSGLERITGVNQRQLSHYATGRRKPCKKTVEKIENSLHSFAKELHQVHFF